MKSSRLVIALPALALTASGCAAFSGDDGTTTVATAFYPLEYVAERVVGDHADVTVLTSPGAEPHDLELTVEKTGQVAGADLVVFETGFQPAVDDAIEQNAEGETLDVLDVVELRPFDESPEEHAEHADEGEGEEHAEEGEEHEDEHDHGSLDPHFWQDPLLMADLGDAVAERMADIDPDHAEDYEQNAADLRSDLESLDTSYADGLADCERDTIVVSHDAFGYLEKYGVHLAPIAGLSPDATPTPADLGELQELIEDEGITTVFTERLAPVELSETLANDLDLETAVLDPVEGLTDETEGEDYLSLMADNLEALRAANGCA